jgi:hypothetical protein
MGLSRKHRRLLPVMRVWRLLRDEESQVVVPRMGELGPFNPRVLGSIPRRPTYSTVASDLVIRYSPRSSRPGGRDLVSRNPAYGAPLCSAGPGKLGPGRSPAQTTRASSVKAPARRRRVGRPPLLLPALGEFTEPDQLAAQPGRRRSAGSWSFGEAHHAAWRTPGPKGRVRRAAPPGPRGEDEGSARCGLGAPSDCPRTGARPPL